MWSLNRKRGTGLHQIKNDSDNVVVVGQKWIFYVFWNRFSEYLITPITTNGEVDHTGYHCPRCCRALVLCLELFFPVVQAKKGKRNPSFFGWTATGYLSKASHCWHSGRKGGRHGPIKCFPGNCGRTVTCKPTENRNVTCNNPCRCLAV